MLDSVVRMEKKIKLEKKNIPTLFNDGMFNLQYQTMGFWWSAVQVSPKV